MLLSAATPQVGTKQKYLKTHDFSATPFRARFFILLLTAPPSVYHIVYWYTLCKHEKIPDKTRADAVSYITAGARDGGSVNSRVIGRVDACTAQQ